MLINNKNETLEVVQVNPSNSTKGSLAGMVVKHHCLGSQPKFYIVPLYELSEEELAVHLGKYLPA